MTVAAVHVVAEEVSGVGGRVTGDETAVHLQMKVMSDYYSQMRLT